MSQNEPLAWRVWCGLLEKITAEGLLDSFPNGGAVIAARASVATLVLTIVLIGLYNLFGCWDGTLQRLTWDASELKRQVYAFTPWTAAFWGATYAGFYTRFSSQWTYLAGTYNQIKQTECVTERYHRPLAEWKAGFIEDAENLHLAFKPIFATTIHHWLDDDEKVRNAFCDYSSRSPEECTLFQRRIKKAFEKGRPRASNGQGDVG